MTSLEIKLVKANYSFLFWFTVSLFTLTLAACEDYRVLEENKDNIEHEREANILSQYESFCSEQDCSAFPSNYISAKFGEEWYFFKSNVRKGATLPDGTVAEHSQTFLVRATNSFYDTRIPNGRSKILVSGNVSIVVCCKQLTPYLPPHSENLENLAGTLKLHTDYPSGVLTETRIAEGAQKVLEKQIEGEIPQYEVRYISDDLEFIVLQSKQPVFRNQYAVLSCSEKCMIRTMPGSVLHKNYDGPLGEPPWLIVSGVFHDLECSEVACFQPDTFTQKIKAANNTLERIEVFLSLSKIHPEDIDAQ